MRVPLIECVGRLNKVMIVKNLQQRLAHSHCSVNGSCRNVYTGRDCRSSGPIDEEKEAQRSHELGKMMECRALIEAT